MTDKFNVFVSYNQADRAWAEWIAWELEAHGHKAIIQAWDFRGNFVLEMQQATAKADKTIAVLSQHYIDAEFTHPEWAAAFKQDPRSEQGILVPVRVGKVELEGLLASIVYVDLVGMDEDTACDLLLDRIEGRRRKPNVKPSFPGRPKPPFPEATKATTGIFNLPHRRNPNFTGRKEILDQLHERLQSGEAAALVQAIAGLGGVGKTQIAIEYAYRHRDDYQVVWWVRAGEPARLAQDYADLTKAVDHPAKDLEDQKVVVDAARRWLNEHHGWLLVFDNAEDRAAIEPYLPPSGRGHVILTSRNPVWGGLADSAPVAAMETDEAVDLLLGGRQATDAEKAGELADELGRLPLALAQAKAYMDETGTSIGGYLDLFRKHQSELLKRGEVIGYDHTVAATWEISFEAATARKASAAALMNIGAFLAPEAIPEDLFPIGDEATPDALADLCRNALHFKDSVGALRRYSLIDTADGTLSFHRLVQAVARDRLSQVEQDHWSTVVVDLVNDALPDKSDDARNWPIYQRLLPHALTVTEDTRGDALAPKAAGRILDHIGNYLRARADYTEAARHLGRARDIRERTLGKEHADVAETLNNLGWLESDQGRYQNAEPLYKRALAIRENVLGPEHPDTATSLNNLASLYQDQGQHPKAEPLLMRALAIRENVLGPEHPDTAASLNNLASLYQDRGQYPKAEPLLKRDLAICESVLGPEHPDTAVSLNNLAGLYRARGQDPKAEQLFKRALAIRENVLGPEHPDTATSLNNLAVLYIQMQRKERAEAYFQKAFDVYNSLLETDPNNLIFQERRERTRIGLERARHRKPVQQGPKVGRNDPCPCGSGQKYKKCCGKAVA